MYVITGGAGFIGSALIWRLNKEGVRDIAVVDNLACTEKWKNLVNRDYVEYIPRDRFLDLVERDVLAWPVEAVVHLGACSSTTERDADFLFRNNTEYTKKLCQYTLEHGGRFINASSAATYGDGRNGFSDEPALLPMLKPLNMYGYSKHLVDLWLLRERLAGEVLSLKFFNVYGPNEYHKADMRSVVCKAFSGIRETGRMELFRSGRPDYADGEQKRDFVYVKDCVELLYWCLKNPQVNGIHNAGAGRARTWNALARAVFAAMGRGPDIRYRDMPRELAGKYQYFTEADMGWLIREACPVRFRSLEEGVEDYVRGYLAREDPYLERF